MDPSDSARPDGASPRRHDFDALRAFAMLLGIGLHASLSFFDAPWPVQDSRKDGLLGLLFLIVHGFRMPLFFIVSGYFTMMMYRKRGLQAVVNQRAARILLPCVLGLLTVVPLTRFVASRAMLVSQAATQAHDVTTLAGAIRAQNQEAVDRLIADPDELNRRDDYFGVTPLSWAILFANETAVERLIEAGADVNLGNRDGSTPLHTAAFFGQPKLADMLLEHGARADARNLAGDEPLKSIAADWETTKFILKLLQVPEPDRKTIEQGRVEVGDRLRAHLLDASSAPPSPDTPNLSEPQPTRISTVAIRDAYQAWLRSPLWQISVGGVSWHLVTADFFAHLWFLWFLCWLVAGFALAVGIGHRFSRHFDISTASEGEHISSRNRRLVRMGLWCLPPLTLLPQSLMGIGVVHFGPDTSTGVIPQPHLLFYYGIFFAYGIVCFEAERLDRARIAIGNRWWLSLSLAVFCVFPAWLLTIGNEAVGIVTQVIYVWLMSFGLMGVFHRYLKSPNRVVRYVSDSSYWLYLAHVPLVIELQLAVCNWSWSAFPKFALVTIVAVLGLMVSYQLLVRHTWIGVLLNGRRPQSAQT